MSFDKQVLFDLLAPRLANEESRWLTRLLVFHDCTQDYVLKGDPKYLSRIPAHKTLFGTGPGKGLPIGNLNSQFFVNVYLNGLDRFVKHELKCRHYLRYCDDFVLLSESREQLLEWRERIRAFLRERLRLELNDARERLRPVSDGVDFLGYIVRGDYRLVRRRVLGNCQERLQYFERRLVKVGEMATRYSFNAEAVEALGATVASYLGHFGQASARRLCGAIWQRFPFLAEYLVLDPQAMRLQVRRKRRRDFSQVAQQYRHFKEQFPEDIVFMQVGAFCEFYGLRKVDSPAAGLELKAMRPTRRGARMGFPLWQWRARLQQLLRQGRSVVLVAETGESLQRLRERVPIARWAMHRGLEVPLAKGCR